MRSTAVIGGAGFIGSALCEVLHRTGRRVLVIGRRPASELSLVEGVEYASGSIEDSSFLRDVLGGCDEIVNLAYATTPKTSFDDPIYDIQMNLPGVVTLLRTLGDIEVGKMVFVSSGGTVYGPARYRPIDEGHPTCPISPYGITKLALEKYAAMFHHLYRAPVVIARPSNPYGPGQFTNRSQGFIGAVFSALVQQRPIQVFGQYGTVRDYIFIWDLAAAIVALLDFGKPGETYNISSGVGRNNLQVIDEIAAVVSPHPLPPVQHQPERKFDVGENILTPKKISDATGWKARTGFRDGLVKMWEELAARKAEQRFRWKLRA